MIRITEFRSVSGAKVSARSSLVTFDKVITYSLISGVTPTLGTIGALGSMGN